MLKGIGSLGKVPLQLRSKNNKPILFLDLDIWNKRKICFANIHTAVMWKWTWLKVIMNNCWNLDTHLPYCRAQKNLIIDHSAFLHDYAKHSFITNGVSDLLICAVILTLILPKGRTFNSNQNIMSQSSARTTTTITKLATTITRSALYMRPITLVWWLWSSSSTPT